ncbi:MAG: aspartate aminotransferase family protein [Gammaproteobacteria bacterium]|nr:MAG: aspartate aminotransferase family protein [Gammaproteobacteria bacterium]
MLKNYPKTLPQDGIGEDAAFDLVMIDIEAKSSRLGSPIAFAHMDPPTPDIASRLVGVNAQHNQNLLHPDLSPFASEVEKLVIDWLAPFYGMADGHMCSGSTIANLTALWCARESGATRVLASCDAHLSIAKSAHILSMDYKSISVDQFGRMELSGNDDLDKTCLVLTAGTTSRGVVDNFVKSNAVWTHVDAAWAGPLRMTKYSHLLDGIEWADSVAISAHKWFYQPKDSALILFANKESQKLVSFGGDYLTVPNVGVQGSRGAAAIPLFATLLAWGKYGLAKRIEKNMDDAQKLAMFLQSHPKAKLKQMPETGVLNWKPSKENTTEVLKKLGECSSSTKIEGELWLRQVAANPYANSEAIFETISQALS